MAKHLRSKVRISLDGDDLYLRASRRNLAIGCFLTVWLAGWTAGCAFLLTRFRWDMPLEDLIFPIPFFVGWFAGAGFWATSLFGSEDLRLGPEGLRYRYWLLLIPVQRRTVPLSELLDVGTFLQVDEQADGGDSYTNGVEIRTYSRSLRFGQALDADDRDDVKQRLRTHLTMLHQRFGTSVARNSLHVTDDLFVSPSSSTTTRVASDGALLLDAPPGTFQRPSDCCYRLDRHFEGVDFVWRGTFSLMGVLFVLGLNLFWSTIVGVFILQLFKDFDLELFLFLIPFELVGLAMFIGWLAILLQPFFRDRWRLKRGTIEHKFSVLWVGPTWRYEVIPLSHLELRRDDGKKKAFWEKADDESQAETGASEGGVERRHGKRKKRAAKVRKSINMRPTQFGRDFELVFMATDGEPLCTIKHLNEGEARWIADVVKGEFPGWFAR